MTMPSTFQIATAIVAACRETGENPLLAAEQSGMLQARHYALHALSRVFPDAPKDWLSKAVGCAGDGKKFWNNSVTQKFKMFVGGPRTGQRIAKWWKESAFDRVIAALRDVTQNDVAAPTPRAPVKLSARMESIVEPTRPAATPGKRKLEDMLRAAVQNTQRMTPPPERQS